MAERILFLDDSPERAKIAKRELLCTHVTTASDCIELLERENWDDLYLDHDLGGDPELTPTTTDANGDTGMSVVNHLCLTRTNLRMRIVVHSLNTLAAPRMVQELRKAGYRVERIPFTNMLDQWRRDA